MLVTLWVLTPLIVTFFAGVFVGIAAMFCVLRFFRIELRDELARPLRSLARRERRMKVVS